MKKSVKILSVVLALVIVLGCFAACGGGEKADTLKVGVQTNTTGHLYTAWDFGEDVAVAYVVEKFTLLSLSSVTVMPAIPISNLPD